MSKKPVSDTTIHVDRSVRPSYPDWGEVMHPELEVTGPAEYSITRVKQWLHEDQKNGSVHGQRIYDHLESHNILKECLGLRDLEEIQKKGIVFFRKYFRDNAVHGWKSVVRGSGSDDFHVPYLCDGGNGIVLGWRCFTRRLYADSPALRFASKQ